MKYKGARILLECLKEQNVDTIFGLSRWKCDKYLR